MIHIDIHAPSFHPINADVKASISNVLQLLPLLADNAGPCCFLIGEIDALSCDYHIVRRKYFLAHLLDPFRLALAQNLEFIQFLSVFCCLM